MGAPEDTATTTTTEAPSPVDELVAELRAEATKRERRRRKRERHERERRQYRREEIDSTGFDDFLALVGSDPSLEPVSTGLRIPAAPTQTQDPTLPIVEPYLFLGAVADLEVGDVFVGYRQLLTIASIVTAVEEPLPRYVIERPVVTPGWHFPDGNASFFFTSQPRVTRNIVTGPFDQMSFLFEEADGPALCYETAHFPAFPPAPGYLGLDAYTAPAILGQTMVASARDVRNPWDRTELHYLHYTATRPTRIRAWIWITQTDPATRPKPILDAAGSTSGFAVGLPPEEAFLQNVGANGRFNTNAQYWRCGVSLVIDRRLR